MSQLGVMVSKNSKKSTNAKKTPVKKHGKRRSSGTARCVQHDRELRRCVPCAKAGVRGAGAGLCEHFKVRGLCRECAKNGVSGTGAGLCEHFKVRGTCQECAKNGVRGAGTGLCEHLKRRELCWECCLPDFAGFEEIDEFTPSRKAELHKFVSDFVKNVPVLGNLTIEMGIRHSSLAIYVGKGTPTSVEGPTRWIGDEDMVWLGRKSATVYVGGQSAPRTFSARERREAFQTVPLFRSLDPRESFFVECCFHEAMEELAVSFGAPRGVVCTRTIGAGNKSTHILGSAKANGTRVPPSGVFATVARVRIEGPPRYDEHLRVRVIDATLLDSEVQVLLTQESPASSAATSAAATPAETPLVSDDDDECIQDLKHVDFAFTGSVPRYTRNVLTRSLTRRGARVFNSKCVLLKSTTLVVGSDPSLKTVATAKHIGVKTISAEEFISKYML